MKQYEYKIHAHAISSDLVINCLKVTFILENPGNRSATQIYHYQWQIQKEVSWGHGASLGPEKEVHFAFSVPLCPLEEHISLVKS